MIDDFDITHRRADLPPEVWDFIKKKGFWAMIIPRKYGGLEFSAYAHSTVVVKIASRSSTVASTIVVPNSLGPAELLLHYGTEEQKKHFLPRLARGEEIPCFGLTGPRVGSDASALPDTGIVCRGTYEGRETIGIRLNLYKRYITLAPIATVIGLAFRLYDPEKLMGSDTTDHGITVALVPRDPPGITIGRRHFPLNGPFQNGPIQRQGRVRAARRDHRRAEDGRPGLAHAGRAALGRALHLAAVDRDRRRQGRRVLDGRLCAHPAPVQPADRQVRGRRSGDRAHGGAHLHHGCRALGDDRRHRRRREAVRARRHPQVSRHRVRPHDGERRDGRAGRQGHHARAEELHRARLPDGAGQHHGRGREHPDAQPDHLRPGRDALPSLRAEGDERRPGPGSRARAARLRLALFKHIGYAISNAVRSFVGAITLSRVVNAPLARAHPALLRAHQPLQRVVRLRDRRRDAVARRLPQEEGEPVGAARRRAVGDVPRLDGAEALREPGPAGGRPADRRARLPLAAVPGAGAAPRLPAQLPGALAGRDHADRHLPARPHLLGAVGPAQPERSPNSS